MLCLHSVAAADGYKREVHLFEPLVGSHLHSIILPYAGNDVGRMGSPLDTLECPIDYRRDVLCLQLTNVIIIEFIKKISKSQRTLLDLSSPNHVEPFEHRNI